MVDFTLISGCLVMDQPFIVSARKYRPATFDTVVGQGHITTTLKNAINNNQLAQAFLFCGPRGVGKTTCARILAKTINCTNRTADIEACDQCDSCKAFNSQASFNIYELDAASNNSVDDIRGLVEQVRYAPQGSKYKVYIIDEVHMLSQAAFNAFLKTLEEPPPYAIFILATTEKHKIIPTILSRCQIFDFNRIKVQDIFAHLKSISKKENISAEDEGLHIIAQKADGALRDALSLFDQTASFTNRNITYNNVIENLNILDYDYYFKITDAIFGNKTTDILLLFNEIIKKGFDGHNFIVGLSEHLRNLMVCKDTATLPLLEVVETLLEKYKAQAAQWPPLNLLVCLGLANDCDMSYKSAKNQRLHVELALLRMCYKLGAKEEADKKKTPDTAQLKVVNEANQDPISPEPPITNGNGKSDNSQKPQPALQVPKLGSLNKIKESIQQKKTEQNSSLDEPVETNIVKVNSKQVLESWQSFIDRLEIMNRPAFITTLKKSNLQFDETTSKITITVPYAYFNFQQLEEYKLELLTFFKTELKNKNLLMEFVAGEKTEKEERILYSSGDKYTHMVEKNPELQNLCDLLGLEFVF